MAEATPPAETPLNTVNGAFPQLVSTSYTTYAYSDNYNVNTQYQTAGLGGTAIGIYGGQRPWKDGMLPYNPHWIELITPNNTVNGTLQGVQIEANTQQP